MCVCGYGKMNVIKICPPPSELCVIKTNIHCPEEGCRSVFKNTGNLDMHLSRHHKRKDILKKGEELRRQYHCPVDECAYNLNSRQFFKLFKYLKQHYLKVHAEKTFQCEKCLKGFSTEAAKHRHLRMCGIKFICSCNHAYESYEALLTHAKRFSHTFDEKFKLYGKQITGTACDNEKAVTSLGICGELQLVSSAVAIPVHLLSVVALSEVSSKSLGTTLDKGIQTDEQVVLNRRAKKAPSLFKSCERLSKRRKSAQTQTGIVSRSKRPKISAQTQTVGDYILRKAMKDADIPVSHGTLKSASKQATNTMMKKKRKSKETQTTGHVGTKAKNCNHHLNQFHTECQCMDTNFTSIKDFSSKSKLNLSDSCNLYTHGIDVGLPDLWVSKKSSSGTQTSPLSVNVLIEQEEILSHSVTQTDLNLSFYESETCEPSSSGIHSSSQTMHNLHRYFEDNSNSSFSAQVNTFEPALATSSCRSNMETNLSALTDEPSQMDSFLMQHHKIAFDVNQSCSIETQTELDFSKCFLTDCTDDGDTSFTFCSNTETQTTEDFPSFDHLLYTNMCTQTCDETFYSEFGFANIQTQTAWPQFVEDDSMFVSTETQTASSGCSSTSSYMNKSWPISKINSETSHMETQTDVDEFGKIIAELSKQSSGDKLL